VCVGQTDAETVQTRASITNLTNLSSPNCATLTCAKRSSSASVSVRNDPRASSAMMRGWITTCPWLRRLRISLFVERRWSIQIVDPDRGVCRTPIFNTEKYSSAC
jgi:hypothetical protein